MNLPEKLLLYQEEKEKIVKIAGEFTDELHALIHKACGNRMELTNLSTSSKHNQLQNVQTHRSILSAPTTIPPIPLGTSGNIPLQNNHSSLGTSPHILLKPVLTRVPQSQQLTLLNSNIEKRGEKRPHEDQPSRDVKQKRESSPLNTPQRITSNSLQIYDIEEEENERRSAFQPTGKGNGSG